MTTETRHVTQRIERPADVVYDYASDPANLPRWAPGLGSSVEQVGDDWFVETGEGRVRFAYAPRNEFGVLDHDVTFPSGDVFYNPMRVIKDGDACEVVFTLRRHAGMTDEEFERDANAIAGDLALLKQVIEAST